MRDLALDPLTDDLALVAGRLALTSGLGALRQKVLVRLRLCLGEWFLDTSVGLPWFSLLGQKNAIGFARTNLYAALATCPGVAEVLRFDFNVATPTRVATVNFTVRSTNGEILTVTDFRPSEVR